MARGGGESDRAKVPTLCCLQLWDDVYSCVDLPRNCNSYNIQLACFPTHIPSTTIYCLDLSGQSINRGQIEYYYYAYNILHFPFVWEV